MREARLLAGIMLLAAVLRLGALAPLSMHHPDEAFQYLEQAHRLVFGYGTITWEYRYGMRSWLVPLLIAAPMKLGAWLAPATSLYARLPMLWAVGAGLSIVWSGWMLGRRWGGIHGLLAAFVLALWFEQVYFSAHLLTEPFATACILLAAVPLLDARADMRGMAIAGLLLGLAAILRFQYGPAIVVLALLACRTNIRDRWLPVVMGATITLLLSSVVDVAMGQWPFAWLVENVQQNLLRDRAAEFGVSGVAAYMALLRQYWHWAMVPILLLLVPAAPRYRPLFWMAVVNILIHMAIGHKEYRFILLSVTIFILLAAIGSAQLALRLRDHMTASRLRAVVLPALAAGWAMMSLGLAMAEPMRDQWTAYGNSMAMADMAGREPELCGLALHDMHFWATGGFGHIHRPVPVYLTGWSDRDRFDITGPGHETRAFNAILSPIGQLSHPPQGFTRRSCIGSIADPNNANAGICLYVRPGGCKPDAATQWELQAVLLRHDR